MAAYITVVSAPLHPCQPACLVAAKDMCEAETDREGAEQSDFIISFQSSPVVPT